MEKRTAMTRGTSQVSFLSDDILTNINSRGRSGLLTLFNAAHAHYASSGEWLAIATSGVADICLWSISLNTVTSGVCTITTYSQRYVSPG